MSGAVIANGRSWPAVRIRHDARKRPHGSRPCGRRDDLDLRLLRDLQRVIHLNAEVSHSAFKLRVSQQELNGPQVLCALVDQGRFRTPHRVRTVGGWIKTGRRYPMLDDPRVLPSGDPLRQNSCRLDKILNSG
jgi:hypothetical protein